MKSSERNDAPHPLEEISRLEAQLVDFNKLNQLLLKISSRQNVEETIKQMVEAALELCHADQGSILLFDVGKEHEARTLIREGGESQQKLDRHLNHLLAGWVSTHKQPLLTHDLYDTFKREKIKQDYGDIISALSVPLPHREKIIGVINLILLNPALRFKERELQLVSILAPHCAEFIANARLHEKLFAETARLQEEVRDKYDFQGIIGHGEKMQAVFSLLQRVIPTDVRVLISGESGTGKERIARVIHYSSLRKEKPFVAVDCGALPANLLESELFGYIKGAFTGADKDRKGLFAEADGGTLFLDEITNMPIEVQSKLLRAIQESEIRPLGSSKTKKVNVRIIVAASNDLQQQVKAGNFRQDLFYRLNVVNIALPPLRERKEDIPVLADYFLKQMNARHGKQVKGFQKDAVPHLEAYAWPGNIRELEHAIERAVVLCPSQRLGKSDFLLVATQSQSHDELFLPHPWEQALIEFKKHYLTQILEHTGGVKKHAADILQVQPAYLSRLLKKLDLE